MSFASRISKVVCIGRNFADHAIELGNKPPSSPFYFLKPPSSILRPNNGPIIRPKNVELHYELELGVLIGKTLKNANPADFTFNKADDFIEGYCLGLDLTARNLQKQAKEKGLPWAISKGYDTFCPIGDFIPKNKVPDPQNATLKLEINGQLRQNDSTNKMIFKIPEILSYISNIMTLEKGDLVLTGTPKGVGEIFPGDKLHGVLEVSGSIVGKLDAVVKDQI